MSDKALHSVQFRSTHREYHFCSAYTLTIHGYAQYQYRHIYESHIIATHLGCSNVCVCMPVTAF